MREALRLWRGPALTGVTPGLAAQATRLEESRLTALADCVDWELATGGHTALVAELTVLVTVHPLRERLVGQLMLALHRSGRTTEALEVYRRTHERLADDLALAPGAQLQQLHTAILRDDVTPIAPISPNVPVPRQLPSAVAGFTGRASQLKELTGLLDRDDTVVISAINGTAGVGKTALAVHWAHQVADRFPDGQLYVNLRGFDPSGQPVAAHRGDPRLPRRARRAGRSGFRPVWPSRRRCTGPSWPTGGCSWCWTTPATPSQVRPLLPGSARCLTVITSRDHLGGLIVSEGARAIPLDLMTTAEAYDLLASRLGPERLAAEPRAVADLIELCARLPLALSIVAARVHPRPHALADRTGRAAARCPRSAARPGHRRHQRRPQRGVLLVLPDAERRGRTHVPAAGPAPGPGHLGARRRQPHRSRTRTGPARPCPS